MPEKDGDEGKSTKSVVNKKQKLGEEGYDIARDMGRVRPSKDKKDATTMPPSKEMEKTRKVNKGPSALDIVKKKYKGQIMKMEELDLTKVAESFGGCIVEVIGPKPNVSAQYTKAMKKNVKRGERVLDKIKSFNDPKQETDTDQQETEKKEPKKFFDPEKAKADRENLISKRKEYGIDRKGNMSDAGAERYARKTKQLSSGSNVPVDVTQDDKELAKRRAVGGDLLTNKKGQVIGRTTGKYGGRLSRKRPSNAKSFADIKAEIDDRSPTVRAAMPAGSGKPLPDKEMIGMQNIKVQSAQDFFDDFLKKEKKKGRNIEDIEGDPNFEKIEKEAETTAQGEKARKQVEKEAGRKVRPYTRVGDVSGDLIQDKPVLDKKGEPVIDPKTNQPKTSPTEVTPSGRTKPFGTLARRAEKAQQTTKAGALTGLAVKTLSPASAGLEAAERLRRGETGMAALSAVQALNIPVISQAAGVVNALKTYQRGQQATPEPQPQPQPEPKADSGGKGGGKGKKTSVATSGGKSKEPTPTGDGVGADLDTLQLRQLGQKLPEVGDKLKRVRPPRLVGGMVGRRSAQGGGAA